MKKTKEKTSFNKEYKKEEEYNENSVLEEISSAKNNYDIDDIINQNEAIFIENHKGKKKIKKILGSILLLAIILFAVSMILPNKFNVLTYILRITNEDEKYIKFDDESMKKIIQKSIYKDGKELTEDDLKEVFEISLSSYDEFDNYEDLLKLKKLRTLVIKNRQDVDFDVIEKLNIKKLILNGCDIKNISSLVFLKSLKVLNLSDNKINKIEDLSKINTLEELILDKNLIKSMGNLYELDNLKKLSLKNNEIEIVNDLDKFKKLEYLDLSRNKIVDTKYLENFNKLENLIFDKSNAQMQGGNNWYMMEKEEDDFIELKWDLDNDSWKSAYDEGRIKDNHLVLDNSTLAYKWVSNFESYYNFNTSIVSSVGDNIDLNDGKIVFRIIKNKKVILEENLKVGEIFNLKDYILILKENEEVYFTFEKTGLEAFTDLIVEKEITEKKVFNAKEDFSSKQSYGGWTYIEKENNNIMALNWQNKDNENEEHWKSNGSSKDWLGIWPDMMYPGNSSDVIRRWTALNEGNISISSSAELQSIGNGDGVELFVNLNDKNIWKATLDKEKKINFSKELMQIKKGEYIDFIVNKKNNIYYDTIIWNYIISYK